MTTARAERSVLLSAALALSAACSNGTGSVDRQSGEQVEPPPAAAQFTVSAAVSGLRGAGLVLQLNSANDLSVEADGLATFDAQLTDGANYAVSVAAQPQSQTCNVTNGSGVIAGADVVDVLVECSVVQSPQYAVGGVVNGLQGSGLVLRNNGADDLAVALDGPFAFAIRLAEGSSYSVTVAIQPSAPAQTCTVANAAGVVGAADVADIEVACSTNQYTIGGSVSGLRGSGLVLQLEVEGERSQREITANGSFDFPLAARSGASYVVSVRAQPRNPAQTCSVENAAGVLELENVRNVRVHCETRSFTIGGRVSGLENGGLVLRNDSESLAIASNGAFTFATPLPSGSAYDVTATAQPSGQSCTVANGSGTVGAADVRNITVSCANETYSIGGAVAGLLGSGLVVQNNRSDAVEIESNGAFVFARRVADGAGYDVTVRDQPSDPDQTCTVSNGSGLVQSADVSNVAVNCTTSDFTIGGVVAGLQGRGLVLRNNDTDELAISVDGPFTFATALPTGAAYELAIAAQPSDPAQVCTLENSNGVVSGANVTNVRVSCTSTQFRVGGSVSGLEGSGLTLQNNGEAGFEIAANGPFTAPGSLPDGSSYDVAVLSQPRNPTQTCVVANGAGTIAGADIADVTVTCSTDAFSIGGRVVGLTGFGLALENNGDDRISISSNGPFTFPTRLQSGASYQVAVAQQPAFSRRTCRVINGSGVVQGGDVTGVLVECRRDDEDNDEDNEESGPSGDE